MNKKFIIAWIVAFVVWMAGSFVVHGVLLESRYAQLPNLYRSSADAESNMHLMLLAHILLAGAFVWIYQRGREDKPWLAQGLRFGLAVAFLTAIPMYMIYYVVQPMPGMLAVTQIVYDTVLLLILGAVTAFLTRETQQ
ncbi:MAG: hypothetical protein OEY04_14760 [Gammaproteobacteria bacterium]|nr:hypothetical protein [Gammaproteobacteria bacterium]